MPEPILQPGFIALHSHRAERLADTLTGWLRAHPLQPLESEVVLVQSNGMAEWIKIVLAREAGVCAATRVELPSRFLWRTYRQVLGAQQVPPDSPLDKLPMTWRLMALLPACVPEPMFAPLAVYLRGDEPQRLLQLASRLADLFDQYQIYRPDWLQDWADGRDVLRQVQGEHPLAPEQRWQAELWRRVLGTLDAHERQATRPALHARALAHLQTGQPPASPVARRVSVFGMSHMPLQLLQMLAALSAHSQVLLAVPNPCQYHWGDIIDGREWLRAQRQRQPLREGRDLSQVGLEQMHLHAPSLLAAWGRQGRDFVRQLDAFDDVQAALALTQLQRLDFFDGAPEEGDTRALAQLQRRIRDLLPSHGGPAALARPAPDDSLLLRVAHSPVRELEVLHDQLLQWCHQGPGGQPLAPREVVVMVPDIESFAPAIRAVFGQYPRSDPRFIPFDIADLGAQALSPLVHALQWLLALPQQRSRMSELVELLEVPALAARFGVPPEGLPTLTRWMAGSGIRWGLSQAHREGLDLGMCGIDNTVLFGVRRMLLGYASGADPVPEGHGMAGPAPYPEVGGLEAELAGALAHLLGALTDWWHTSSEAATPAQWAERGRALLAALFKPQSEADRQAMDALEQALQSWVQACEQAGFAQAVPLAVAREAWLQALQLPRLEQRFRAGGVTFCTLMPMRAIPFEVVCLLGMNDGDYPRRSPRADFDLMGLPGQARAGDRSRRDDDRQLMLEALMSARQALYISWSGRSVRDNSEQPPSVLVSQLRDEIDLLWGPGSADALTSVHPLQPFSRRYFEADSPLQTYAREWRAVQAPSPVRTSRTVPTALALPALLAANEQAPVITLAQLARFLRRPVGTFFRERLQVNLQDERSELHDEELFGLQGLDLHHLLAQALEHAPASLPLAEVPHHVQTTVQRLREAGALPLAGVGQLEAHKLQQILGAQLEAAQREREACPVPAERVLVDLTHPSEPVRLQDSVSGASGPSAAQAGEPGVLIHLHASSVAKLEGQSPQARAEPLIEAWLQALAAAAAGQALRCVVVGRNAVLRLPALAPEAARAQLQVLLATWAEGMRWPLPLPPALALQWLNKPQASQALLELYEGADFQRAERERDPALARTYPTLADLLATGAFERLAEAVYAPLRDWAAQAEVLPLAEGADTPTEAASIAEGLA